MPINIDYYVNITSGVGAGEVLPERQLIPMIFDDNALIPSGSFVNFPNNNDGAANVLAYFGSGSEEYKRALFAFGWISKEITTIPSISFARWNSAAAAPVIFGDPRTTATALASWTSVSAGAFHLTMGGFTFSLTGMDFTAAGSLAAVAAIIQAAIEAETGGGALWTGATVTYNATPGRFQLVGGATGAAVISVTAGAGGSDIAGQLGWLSPSAIFGPGAVLETPSAALTALNQLNNNFGGFLFMATLTTDQITAVATTNNSFNEVYTYSVPCTTGTASAIQTAIGQIGGCTTTLVSSPTQYEEQMPLMINASINYNNLNSTQNNMFQQFPGITPTVTDTTTAQTYDALAINYYANTQQAGQVVSLYQRGIMNGGPQDARSQNTYANEVWLKGAMTSSLMSLLLALNKISANNRGKSQVLAIVQDVINDALNNGTISVGRALTAQEKLYITNATGDNAAWQQVQNIGYWVDVSISTEVIASITNYIIDYTLIYAQDAVVNKIEGTDILI